MTYENLLKKINNRTVKITVIGLGYVGLPVAQAFEKAGFEVVGYDKSQDRLDEIDRLGGRLGVLRFYTDKFSVAVNSDVFIVCVPTPLTKDGKPDLSHVQDVASMLPTECLVINESTVAPGDTERCFSRMRWLAYSPERVDPGSDRNITKIPKLIAGRPPESLSLAAGLYKRVFYELHVCPNVRTAEMAKLMENTYRAVNIALANEFKAVAETLDVDVWEATKAAATKPFGYQAFYPGPGVGGHCIPIDPVYLLHATSPNSMPLVSVAHAQNACAPMRIAKRIERRLPSGRSVPPGPVQSTTILIVGLAYKKNVGDIRESPAVDLMTFLKLKGYRVAWHDPHVRPAPEKTTCLMEWSKETVSRFDAVVITTDHDCLDYSVLDEHPCVFDTRGRLPRRDNVHRI